MDFANPLSSLRTLGDFFPSSYRGGSGSEAGDAPPLNERNFSALGGACRGTSSRGRGGGGTKTHRSRSRLRCAPVNKNPSIAPVAVQPASWAERRSSSKSWSPCGLRFFELVVKDGAKVAVCPPEEVESAAKN